LIKKIIIYSVLGFLIYKGTMFYMTYRTVNQMTACAGPSVIEKMEEMKKNKTPELEQAKYGAKIWACVKDQQNFADAMFFKIQESWLNPEPWLQAHPRK
jgi:hypothetical protein